MRLKAAEVDAFVARPRPEVATVLLYGPDAGLVAERARKLALRVVPSLDDPFQVSELDPDLLEREPGRLVEEAQALCLMGGRRLVRVRNAHERIAPALEQLLALEDPAGFVLIEAEELAGGSKIRRLAEAARKGVALPCYRVEDRKLGASIAETLRELGLRVEADALGYLRQHLGADRGATRAELEKLALYLADQPDRVVRLKDAAAVVGDSDAVEVDDMVRAALTGDRARLERALDRLLAEGANPSMLLRACVRALNQALRLKAEAAVPGGKTVAAALAALHFRQRDLLEAVLRDWSGDRLLGALARLQEAEIRSRATKAPAELICRAALAGLGGR